MRWVGSDRHAVAPAAARRRRPGGGIPQEQAIKPERPLSGLDRSGEYRAIAFIGQDAQRGAISLSAGTQDRQECAGDRDGIESGAVRPPVWHLAEQPPLVVGGSGSLTPREPGDQQRLSRIGEHLDLRDES